MYIPLAHKGFHQCDLSHKITSRTSTDMSQRFVLLKHDGQHDTYAKFLNFARFVKMDCRDGFLPCSSDVATSCGLLDPIVSNNMSVLFFIYISVLAFGMHPSYST